MSHIITKQLVKKLLENASNYSWSLQGLGMLRLYLSDEVRLHVWHGGFSFPRASTMHTHPWDFRSLVIAGHMQNFRWVADREGDWFNSATILCGEGGCMMSEPKKVRLIGGPMEHYLEGQQYIEKAEEIHESFPFNGTVTLVERFFKPDRDHAKVFWPIDHNWGSAEPRPATREEVEQITNHSLRCWFQ
jgi:hypothetical protein